MKKMFLSIIFLGFSLFVNAQNWGGYVDGYYYNSDLSGFNMSQHMINTYQNLNNWNNYLYQMQMQQMQQMHQMGIMYQTDNATKQKQKQKQKQQKCSECAGTGKIKSYYKVNGEMRVTKRTCTFCNGTGRSEY